MDDWLKAACAPEVQQYIAKLEAENQRLRDAAKSALNTLKYPNAMEKGEAAYVVEMLEQALENE